MTIISAFDADVVIYAASPGHPLGARVAALWDGDEMIGVGSLLLLTETLTKPMRVDSASTEVAALARVLARLDLWPLDLTTARLSLTLSVAYGLRAADSTHLATAIVAGADRFITNNRRDFPKSISEIEVVYPDDLQ